jgi:hypothetical protein
VQVVFRGTVHSREVLPPRNAVARGFRAFVDGEVTYAVGYDHQWRPVPHGLASWGGPAGSVLPHLDPAHVPDGERKRVLALTSPRKFASDSRALSSSHVAVSNQVITHPRTL